MNLIIDIPESDFLRIELERIKILQRNYSNMEISRRYSYYCFMTAVYYDLDAAAK